MAADDPKCKIERKIFHSEIIKDHDALKKEDDYYKELPQVRVINNIIIQQNYLQIKQDIEEILHSEMERLIADSMLCHLIINKK
ncbi:hypothetical protein [Flavobacterium panacagri]|uniref:hypothetical protein n=1 Tax=Flavobacterium panacagri TaxID=3034146 RepID=UPI0025A56BBB|nr:hypothetical protein [Flavobacterium panacagri]